MYICNIYSFFKDIYITLLSIMGLPGGSVVKNLPDNAGDMGFIPGLRRSPGEGNGNLLQYSCMGNPMDREAGWVIVHGMAKESDMTWRLNTMNLSKPCRLGSISESHHTDLPQSAMICPLQAESTSKILRHVFLALSCLQGSWQEHWTWGG